MYVSPWSGLHYDVVEGSREDPVTEAIHKRGQIIFDRFPMFSL